jgi:hypothetical protein
LGLLLAKRTPGLPPIAAASSNPAAKAQATTPTPTIATVHAPTEKLTPRLSSKSAETAQLAASGTFRSGDLTKKLNSSILSSGLGDRSENSEIPRLDR